MKYLLLVLTLLFVGLSFLVKSVTYFPLDLVISQKVQSINFPGFAEAMTILSNSGWGIFLYTWVGLITISLFLLGKKLASLFIIFISILDIVLFFGISKLVNRPRPTTDFIRVDFQLNIGGFPSGHVLMYTLVFGFLIYLAYVYVKNIWIRNGLTFIFSALIFLIGLARIYSGQHWPTDILGGYLLGGIGLIVTIYFYKTLKDPKVSSFLMRFLRLPGNR